MSCAPAVGAELSERSAAVRERPALLVPIGTQLPMGTLGQLAIG